MGTGARSEKIRTYNYKDSRCTDHRLNRCACPGPCRRPPLGYAHTHALMVTCSNFGLDGVLGGAIEPIIQQCIALDEQERIAELNSDD